MLIFGADAGPLVSDEERDEARIVGRSDLDRSASLAHLQRIADEIGKHLLDALAIDVHEGIATRNDTQRDAGRLGKRSERIECLTQQLGARERHPIETQRAGGRLLEVEQIRDELPHRRHRAPHPLGHGGQLLVRRRRHRLDAERDHGERAAQIMRHHGRHAVVTSERRVEPSVHVGLLDDELPVALRHLAKLEQRHHVARQRPQRRLLNKRELARARIQRAQRAQIEAVVRGEQLARVEAQARAGRHERVVGESLIRGQIRNDEQPRLQ